MAKIIQTYTRASCVCVCAHMCTCFVIAMNHNVHTISDSEFKKSVLAGDPQYENRLEFCISAPLRFSINIIIIIFVIIIMCILFIIVIIIIIIIISHFFLFFFSSRACRSLHTRFGSFVGICYLASGLTDGKMFPRVGFSSFCKYPLIGMPVYQSYRGREKRTRSLWNDYNYSLAFPLLFFFCSRSWVLIDVMFLFIYLSSKR
jgi:hypothetical protein